MDDKRPQCDWHDCEEGVCDHDLENYTPPTRRYCQAHSDEFQAIVDIENVEESARAMLGWWVASYGGAKKAAKRILGGE